MGAALVVLGAILLAAKGLFAKALYAQGMTYHDVAAVRSVLAIPGFILVAAVSAHRFRGKPSPKPTALHLIAAAAAGLWCYYFGALANFYALTLIQANVERALLFSYPAMVVLFSAITTRAIPSRSTMVALTTTSLGVLLVTGAADAQLSSDQWQGIFWVLFCSVTIACYFMANGALTQNMSSATFTLTAMTAAGTAFFVHHGLIMGWLKVELPGISLWIMLGLVVFATVLPLFCVAEGIRRIGASRGALLSTVGPPATAFMAYLIYDERLTALQFLGTVLVVLSVGVLEWRSAYQKAKS
ncbi:MAG: DMT family transporter [Luminiphilus sp.]|nr:DMT family transporter [Luminiphilus sp.]